MARDAVDYYILLSTKPPVPLFRPIESSPGSFEELPGQLRNVSEVINLFGVRTEQLYVMAKEIKRYAHYCLGKTDLRVSINAGGNRDKKYFNFDVSYFLDRGIRGNLINGIL